MSRFVLAWRGTCLSAALLAGGAPALAQEPQGTPGAPNVAGKDDALQSLQRQQRDLAARIESLAAEIERIERASPAVGGAMGSATPTLGTRPDLGPAAAKVYSVDRGVSIGGYGEFLYDDFMPSSAQSDELDLLRAVLYFGYRFDERWLWNSEIEYEHGGEEVGVEFAYLDWLGDPRFNVRSGLVLIPLGFVNELHEPTTFVSTRRPEVERRILPSTWREAGAGVHGEWGDFIYRTYVTSGFDASGFGAAGLRGGRQNGAEAAAEDLAWSARLDWHGIDGLTIGAGSWLGDSGQEAIPGADVSTAIVEGHAEWRWRGLRLRGLWTEARLGDVAELNAALSLNGAQSIGERLEGGYLEASWNVLSWLRPESAQSLSPFLRYELLDTQAEVPTGFASDPANDLQLLTVGVTWQPDPRIVFKADATDVDDGDGSGVDRFSLSMGYAF